MKINKLKRQVEARNNTKERREVMMQIESALNLMGIKFEKYKDFKIRVIPEPEEIFGTFGVDFAKFDSHTQTITERFSSNGLLHDLTYQKV